MSAELARLRHDEPEQLERFARDHWDRRACRLEYEPLLSPQAAFETAALYNRLVDGPDALVRVWADDHIVHFPRDRWFRVAANDGSFAGWAERVTAGAAVLAMNHKRLQNHGGWPLWDRLTCLLRPVFERTGLMYGKTEASLICGLNHTVASALENWSKWDRAPDTGHLVFVASGRIRATVEGHAQTLHEGELVYAPSGAVTDAVFDGVGCALVVSVRAGTAEERADRILRELISDRAYETRLVCPHNLQRAIDVHDDVPPALRETVAALRDHTTSATLETEMLSAWRAYETRLGFSGSPAPSRDRELGVDARIAARPGLHWGEYRERLFVAANGHVLRVPDHPAFRGLLAALAAGETGRASDLVGRFCAEDDDGPSEDHLFALLQAMFERHAIALIDD